MFKENQLSFFKTAVVNNIYKNIKNNIKNNCSDYIDYRMLLQEYGCKAYKDAKNGR